MKKILLSAFLCLFAFSYIQAYELNGDLKVQWTGYKLEKKAPVSGGFKDVALAISKSDDFKEFLKSAKVKIDTLSFDSKNPARDKNITSTLFSLASSKTILASIKDVNTDKKTLDLELTLNEVTKIVPMSYEIKDNVILAKGDIDVLDFALKDSFLKFAKICAAHHENKSYSEVGIMFELPFK